MERNRKPQEETRSSQVSTAEKDESVSCPCKFGLENGGSGVSELLDRVCVKDRTSMLSRLGNNEKKWDSCRGVQRGDSSVIDRRVGEKCPKWCSSPGIK